MTPRNLLTGNLLHRNRSAAVLPAVLALVALATGFASNVIAASPEAAMPLKGALLFEDAFSRTELGPAWDVHPNSFRIENGVLIAGQRPEAGHGAVSQTFLDFQDIILQFSFRLDGAAGFNVVIDDRKYRGSHAGHICRVTVRRNRISLQDDKTGAMRNDLFEKLRDPQQRVAAKRLLVGKSKTVARKIEPGKWYQMTISLAGEMMQVMLDGKPLAALESAGIGHPTKTDFGFTIIGRSVRFDNIAAWSVVAR